VRADKLLQKIVNLMKLLFVCSANLQRSVTGEKLFSGCPGMETRSAGTNPAYGRTPVSQELVDWADVIFVMNEKNEGHMSYLRDNFDLTDKRVNDLGIEDRYFVNEPELERLLIEKVSKYIDLKPCMERLLEEAKEL